MCKKKQTRFQLSLWQHAMLPHTDLRSVHCFVGFPPFKRWIRSVGNFHDRETRTFSRYRLGHEQSFIPKNHCMHCVGMLCLNMTSLQIEMRKGWATFLKPMRKLFWGSGNTAIQKWVSNCFRSHQWFDFFHGIDLGVSRRSRLGIPMFGLKNE